MLQLVPSPRVLTAATQAEAAIATAAQTVLLATAADNVCATAATIVMLTVFATAHADCDCHRHADSRP